MFSEAVMAEAWDGVGWLEPMRHKAGLLGGCDPHTGVETSVGMLQARQNH
jgi:hypothetical protein